jgi:hypothetical protein
LELKGKKEDGLQLEGSDKKGEKGAKRRRRRDRLGSERMAIKERLLLAWSWVRRGDWEVIGLLECPDKKLLADLMDEC